MKTTANIAGTKAEISATLKLSSGTVLLETRDFVQSSLVFKTGTSNSGEFTVGAAIIGGVDFALMNDTGKFSGLSWGGGKVDITLSFGETATLRMGEFYIVSHRETGKIVSVECHDALKVLDEHELYEVLNETAVTGSITFPTTITALANAIAAYNGCTISGLQHGDIQIDDPGNDHMTQRACLSYLAQMTGQYVTAHNDVLTFGWYDMASVHDAGTTFSHDLETDDIIITGVNVSDSGDTVTETLGSAGHMVNIADNPFISAGNTAAVASAVFAAVDGLQYRPGTVEIMSNAAIEAGDVLSIRTGQESGIVIIASTVTYKASTLRQSITADAEAYAGDLRVTQSQYFKRVAKQAISDDLRDPNSDLSKAIGGGGSSSGSNSNITAVVIPEEVELTKEPDYPPYFLHALIFDFGKPKWIYDSDNVGEPRPNLIQELASPIAYVNKLSSVAIQRGTIAVPRVDFATAATNRNSFTVSLNIKFSFIILKLDSESGKLSYEDWKDTTFDVIDPVVCRAHWEKLPDWENPPHPKGDLLPYKLYIALPPRHVMCAPAFRYVQYDDGSFGVAPDSRPNAHDGGIYRLSGDDGGAIAVVDLWRDGSYPPVLHIIFYYDMSVNKLYLDYDRNLSVGTPYQWEY